MINLSSMVLRGAGQSQQVAHEAHPCKLKAHVVLLCCAQRQGASVLWVGGLQLPCTPREKSGQDSPLFPLSSLQVWLGSEPKRFGGQRPPPCPSTLFRLGICPWLLQEPPSGGGGWITQQPLAPSPAQGLQESLSCRGLEPGTDREVITTKGLWVAVLRCHQPEWVTDPEPPPHLNANKNSHFLIAWVSS